MGWNTLAVIAQLVIIEGPNDGLFVYSPSAGAGNLVASVAAQDGTDPDGNADLAGVTSYDVVSPTLSIALSMNNGQQTWYTASSEAGPWTGVAVIELGGFGFTGASEVLQLFAGGGIRLGTAATHGMVFLPPSGDATGVTDTANLAGILSFGATPWLLPGTFNLNCGDPVLTALTSGNWIFCSGERNTFVNALGTGDLFRWLNATAYSDKTHRGGGLIGGCTIDGSGTTGNANAVRAGDNQDYRFQFTAQSFNQGTVSWGLLLDNQNFWTERCHLDVSLKDCGVSPGNGGHFGLNVGGLATSTGSFARLRGRVEITQGNNQQDGVVLMNGAHIYDHELEIVGNFTGGAAATTAAALRITGTVPAGHPGAGTHSAISNGRLDIGVECSAGVSTPVTLVQASTSNSITDCYGNLNFNQNFTSSGITGAGFKFFGQVQGDVSLGTRLAYGTAPVQTITANGQTILAIVPSAKIPIAAAASFTALVLSPGDVDGQVIWLVNTSSHNQTFDIAANSNVASGASAVLTALTASQFVWDAGTALWYQA